MTKEEKREYMRKRRINLKEQGLCTRCGRNPVENGYSMCTLCRKKDRVKYKRIKEILKCYRMKENI
jgi:hypothetical protein